ncbi:transcriptional regulator, TetR family [Paenibacillus sp. UNCCL117]|uniref:TetR/AcrR family transcriptional regulator n=1 Tax=unclassified Paenibacillus TaxID=185978 RepID=UPI0008817D7F|nr:MULTISPECIES: TetR/AcrR family transcriptional regulator [unclassified Paenibacillus]SDC12509.1 DNA-binding transcriptional regulator, AcrR family [Paenibacillus sp. cl123]SFW16842.1 transcriptional regulator, TetR family [Paenibacillus sp. UNCCL117]
MRKKKEEATETIRKLIEVARTHFTAFGYANVALESIVLEANLTRGAVYHHFRSKKELFRIVLEDVQREVAENVELEASTSDDIWQQLYLGCRAFIMAAVEERNRRIMLIDGPAILGWEVWREMDSNHSMRLLREQIKLMQEQGCFRMTPLDALTHFISGGLNETALWLANESLQRPDALDETMKLLGVFLNGFKQNTAP